MATYNFSSDLDGQIKQQLLTGQYASEEEVLREALRALKARDEEVAAIQEGVDDMEAGRVKPLRQFDSEFRQQNNISQDA